MENHAVDRRASSQHSSLTSISVVHDLPRYAQDCPKAFLNVPASQLAASAAGSVPPLTKPKYRPPALTVVAGEPMSSCPCDVHDRIDPRRGAPARLRKQSSSLVHHQSSDAGRCSNDRLVVDCNKANRSPILKLFLSKVDDLTTRIPSKLAQ
jgi:hypothetical protein